MLIKDGYKKRLVEKSLDKYLETFGAVCVQGPKMCGKTWASLSRANSVIYIGDHRNNFQNRTLAQIDPSLVLEGERPHLVDEWQEVPGIWDAVRFKVDEDGAKGAYILTGSSTPKHKGIMHSGTGRIATISMSPMSLYESGDSDGSISLMSLFTDGLDTVKNIDMDLRKLIKICIRGGWPSTIDNSGVDTLFARSYLKTIVEEDMTRLDDIKRDRTKVWSLIRSLARNESTLVTNKKLKEDMGLYDDINIDPDTVSAYLDALRRSFIIWEQPSYAPRLRSSKRLLKSPKRHLADPSLAVAALGASEEMLFNDLETFGFIFEALCERDLKVYAECNDGSLYHFRSANGEEIDAIIEYSDGTYGAFEIKLGAHQIDKASEDLINFKNMITNAGGKEPKVLAVICGLTNISYTRPDGVIVLSPFNLLP